MLAAAATGACLPTCSWPGWLAGWMLAQWVVVAGCPCVCLSVCLHGWMGGWVVQVYETTPDWKVPLSPRGHEQARETGRKLKAYGPTHPPWAISQ